MRLVWQTLRQRQREALKHTQIKYFYALNPQRNLCSWRREGKVEKIVAWDT